MSRLPSLKLTACYKNDSIIRVTAIGSDGNLAPNASFGNWVHLAAPGTSIRSTVPLSVKGKISSSYTDMSGTSQATAFVTGAALLYKSVNRPATIMQIKDALTTYAKFNSSLNNTLNPLAPTYIKNGAILDIYKAIINPLPALRQQ